MPTAPGCSKTSRETSSPSSWRYVSTRRVPSFPSYLTSSPVFRNGVSLMRSSRADDIREDPACGETGGEEQRVLLDAAAHGPRGQAAGAVAVEVGLGLAPLVPVVAALPRRSAHGHGPQQQVEHRAGVVGEPAVTEARVARGHARGDQGAGAEAQGGVRGVEGGEAAVAER